MLHVHQHHAGCIYAEVFNEEKEEDWNYFLVTKWSCINESCPHDMKVSAPKPRKGLPKMRKLAKVISASAKTFKKITSST